ncbi:hypothetical protein PIB19_03250 [Sphingomonas sp. 7/4-4]|uniref:hypothetical protein n=1 Tax=Sphingomonas sp. 7/4-4 TaxID=3018446 RepID=UPI0022F3F937|nr:hypothetical protein [Sphingomonas sp. 7/4-4]WBY08520.1 hypothetical protein PIB19_03250 [Sphingomonas sp. 7/4-4]
MTDLADKGLKVGGREKLAVRIVRGRAFRVAGQGIGGLLRILGDVAAPACRQRQEQGNPESVPHLPTPPAPSQRRGWCDHTPISDERKDPARRGDQLSRAAA